MGEFELEISSDGTIRTIYRDGIEEVAEALGAEIKTVQRASNVEWEEVEGDRGWSIRAAHNPRLAIRRPQFSRDGELFVCCEAPLLPVAVFPKREQALEIERAFFFELLPKKENAL